MDFTTLMAESQPMAPESPTPRGPHRALASVMPKLTHGVTLPSTTASTAHTASEWLVTLAPLSPTPRGPHRVLARGQPPRPRPLPRPPTLARPPHTLARLSGDSP